MGVDEEELNDGPDYVVNNENAQRFTVHEEQKE